MIKFSRLNITGFLLVVLFFSGIDSQGQSTFTIDPSLTVEGNFHISPKNNYFIGNEGFHNDFISSAAPSDFTIDFPMLAQDDLFIAPQKKSFFKTDAFRIGFVPALFFTASAATWGDRENIREIRNRYIPTFANGYDNYMQ